MTRLALLLLAAIAAPRLTQRVIFLQPAADRLSVSESWFFRNESSAAFRFFLPEAAGGKVTVIATAPQGAPVELAPARTPRPNVYKVDLPARPGETRIDLTYVLPRAETFSSKMFYSAPTRLVVPGGFTLSGEGLESLGSPPGMRASIYAASAREFTVLIQGAPAEEPDADTGPSIQQILPRLYDNLPWILAPAFLVLLFGFILLYRRPLPSRDRKGAVESPR